MPLNRAAEGSTRDRGQRMVRRETSSWSTTSSTRNSAGVGGGVFASSYTTQGIPGTVTATNNTITGNAASVYGGGAFLYAYSNTIPGGILDCYNNILWGNTGPKGADIDISDAINSTRNGYNNVVSAVSGTWTNSGGNI